MAIQKHAFRFKIDGQKNPMVVWTKVVDARAPVDLVVTAEDVQRSMQQHGVGNTQTCTMAVCAKRHAQQFPHPVEGYVDWQYSRAYVVSKLKNGLPSRCVVYRHNSEIAKLNDTKGGQAKLLVRLQTEGPMTVKLAPIGAYKRQKKAEYSKKFPRRLGGATGERKSKTAHHGAAARYAFAKLGGALD